MDARPDIATAPFRDPRYAPRRLEVERRPDGSVILFNATPIKGASRLTHQCRGSEPLLQALLDAPGLAVSSAATTSTFGKS